MPKSKMDRPNTPAAAVRAVSHFLALVHADWRADVEKSAAARQGLRDLGIEVKLTRRWRGALAQGVEHD